MNPSRAFEQQSLSRFVAAICELVHTLAGAWIEGVRVLIRASSIKPAAAPHLRRVLRACRGLSSLPVQYRWAVQLPEHRALSEWPDQRPRPAFRVIRPEPAANLPGTATETRTAPLPVTRPRSRTRLG
jgi:hypothetical protein